MTALGHVVVGTAGHIDHGKTMLVQALTGKNTDRLHEEQTRGISIDIDFAPLVFADGTVAGLVDVPGHERFVRNMVAGAAGIDGALIVVDINEGMMPQTYEHLAILQLLGVQRAVVALTKVDLADPDLVDVAAEVVREALVDTAFAKAPMVPTSVKTGEGLDELRELLYELIVNCEARDERGSFRMPIDKIFSIPGFGTVVSGTIWRGHVETGDTLDVLPQRQSVRIRGIQVHGQDVKSSDAGQRTALNVVGIDKDQLRRGNVMGAPGTLVTTQLVDAKVQVLPQAADGLQHRHRVHVHIGTAEAIGTVLLLDDDVIAPGGEGYCQIQLDRPIVADALDRFIIRRYSPVTTLGGGHVIDPKPQRLHRRKREHVLAMLADRDNESPRQRLLALLRGGNVQTVAELANALGLTPAETTELLDAAREEELVAHLPGGWTDSARIQHTLHRLEEELWELHQKQRLLDWVPRTQLLAALDSAWKQRDALWLLEEGVRRGTWIVNQTLIRAADWVVRLSDEEQRIHEDLLHRLRAKGLQPQAAEDLIRHYPKRDRVAMALLRRAQEAGQVVEVADSQWLHRDIVEMARKQLAQLFAEQGPFTVAAARDVLDSNRKVTIMLLEYFDDRKITVRRGDLRSVTTTTKA